MWSIFTTKYDSAIKKNVIILATTWKNLKSMEVSEGRQSKEVHTE